VNICNSQFTADAPAQQNVLSIATTHVCTLTLHRNYSQRFWCERTVRRESVLYMPGVIEKIDKWSSSVHQIMCNHIMYQLLEIH